jgi:hypothetical protein
MGKYVVEYKSHKMAKEGASNAFTWWPTGAKPECNKAEALRRFEFLRQCGFDGIDPEGDDPPYVVRIKDVARARGSDTESLGEPCSYIMLHAYVIEGDEPAGPWANELDTNKKAVN